MVDFAYIRPCGVFPDGLELPPSAMKELKARKLIWEQTDYPGDYGVEGKSDSEEEDRAAALITQIVERAYAQDGFPVGTLVQAYNPYTKESVTGPVTALAVSELDDKPYNTVKDRYTGQEIVVEPRFLRSR